MSKFINTNKAAYCNHIALLYLMYMILLLIGNYILAIATKICIKFIPTYLHMCTCINVYIHVITYIYIYNTKKGTALGK